MVADSASEYEPSYRQKSVDKALDEHDARISRNEKRTKGALAMLAATKGIDFGIGQLGTLL